MMLSVCDLKKACLSSENYGKDANVIIQYLDRENSIYHIGEYIMSAHVCTNGTIVLSNVPDIQPTYIDGPIIPDIVLKTILPEG
jgi:hypothetical protein